MQRIEPAPLSSMLSTAGLLRRIGRLDEARATLVVAAGCFPDDASPWHDLARLAESRGLWPEAEGYWRRHLSRDDSQWPVHAALVGALRAQQRWAEAEAVLTAAQYRFANDRLPIDTEHARIAEAKDDWAAAEQRWQAVTVRFRDESAGPIGQIRALRRLGEITKADVVAKAAMRRLPRAADLAEQFARNAMESQNWPLSLARLKTASRKFPFSEAIRLALYDVKLRMLESGLARPNREKSVIGPPASRPGLSEVAANFESLGGGVATEGAWGFGCEFGFFQRHAGVEPISLLRWASISPTSLTAALEWRFADIDRPEETLLRDQPGALDWAFSQTRYDLMVDHTNLPIATVPDHEAHRRVSRLLSFLALKLIRDLANDEKIFVYRVIGAEIGDRELDRLASAVAAYGRNRLMFVRKTNDRARQFTVETMRPGFFIGYIDRFSTESQDQPFNDNHDGWEKLCRAALDAVAQDAVAPDAAAQNAVAAKGARRPRPRSTQAKRVRRATISPH